MKKAGSYDHLLDNLSVLYLALAYGVDEELDNAELDLMVERLGRWQDQAASGSILASIKRALSEFVNESSRANLIESAIVQLRTNCTPEQRALILDDLVSIAVADNKYLSEEGRFIQRIARGWDVHPPEIGKPSFWSILNFSAGEWSPIHDLAFVYLTVAHKPDNHIAVAEIEAISKKIKEWLPAAREEDVASLMQSVLKIYATSTDDERLVRAILSVKHALPSHQHAALLADLRYIANADGVMLVKERMLIERIAKALGLSMPEG